MPCPTEPSRPFPAPRRAWAFPCAVLLAGWTVFLSACFYPQCDLPSPGDTGRDLNSFLRVLHGEVPYRDFLWIYGPAMTWFYAGVMKLLGVSLASVQLGYFLWLSLAALATYRLALRLLPPVGAWCAALLFYGTAFAHHTYNHIGCTLTAVVAVEAFLARASDPARARGLPWRVVVPLALCAWVKLNVGLALAAALAAAEGLALWLPAAGVSAAVASVAPAPAAPAARTGRQRLRDWLAAFLTLTLLLYAPVLAGTPTSRLRQAFPWTAIQYGVALEPRLRCIGRLFIHGADRLAQGDLAGVVALFDRWHLVPVLAALIWIYAGQAVVRWVVAPACRIPARWVPLTLGLAGTALSHEFLRTGRRYSLFYFPSPFLILLGVWLAGRAAGWLLGRLRRKRAPWRRSGRRAVLLAAGAGSILVAVLGTRELATHTGRAEHPRLRVYLPPGAPLPLLDAAGRFVESNLAPGEPLLALPYAALYNYLTDHRNPLWTDEWLRLNDFSAAEEAELLEEIEASGVRCVLVTDDVLQPQPAETADLGTAYGRLLLPYLVDRFEPLCVFGPDGLWLSSGDRTPNRRLLVLWRRGAARPARLQLGARPAAGLQPAGERR